MTRIGSTEQVLLLLREQISRIAKDRARAGRNTPSGKARSKQPLARLRELATRDGLSDEDLNHALVRSVLLDTFGDALGADARFETLAADVMRIVAQAPDGAALLADAFRQLGKA